MDAVFVGSVAEIGVLTIHALKIQSVIKYVCVKGRMFCFKGIIV